MRISKNKLKSVIRKILIERYLEPEEYDELHGEGELGWEDHSDSERRESRRDKWMHKYIPGSHSRRREKKKYQRKYKSKRQRWAEDPRQLKMRFDRGER